MSKSEVFILHTHNRITFTSVGDNFSLTSFQTAKTNSRPHQA